MMSIRNMARTGCFAAVVWSIVLRLMGKPFDELLGMTALAFVSGAVGQWRYDWLKKDRWPLWAELLLTFALGLIIGLEGPKGTSARVGGLIIVLCFTGLLLVQRLKVTDDRKETE